MLIKNSKINQFHGAVCSLNSWPRNSPHFINLKGLWPCSRQRTHGIKMQIYSILCVVMCSVLKAWHYNINRKVHLEPWSNYLGPSFTETKMVPEKSKYEDRKTPKPSTYQQRTIFWTLTIPKHLYKKKNIVTKFQKHDLFWIWLVWRSTSSSSSRRWTSFNGWKFRPSQWPLSISLDPGHRLSSFLYEDLLHVIMKLSSYKIVILHLCWLTGPRVDIKELPVGGAPTLTVCTWWYAAFKLKWAFSKFWPSRYSIFL